MRRLKKKKAKKAEEPAAPKAEVAVVEDKGGGLPALAGDFAELGTYEKNDNLTPASGTSVPYLGFYSKKANKAVDISKALGSVTEGTPYLAIGGDFYRAGDSGFVVLAEFPYWATAGADFAPNRVWLKPQPFGAKHQDGDKLVKIQEQMVSVVLFLPPLHEDLVPGCCTCTNWRATKVKCPKRHLEAVEEAMTPEWAQANGEVVSKMPPRFRVVSKITTEARSGEFPYTLADSVSAPINVSQAEALMAWWNDEECQDERIQVEEAFQRQVDQLLQLRVD